MTDPPTGSVMQEIDGLLKFSNCFIIKKNIIAVRFVEDRAPINGKQPDMRGYAEIHVSGTVISVDINELPAYSRDDTPMNRINLLMVNAMKERDGRYIVTSDYMFDKHSTRSAP